MATPSTHNHTFPLSTPLLFLNLNLINSTASGPTPPFQQTLREAPPLSPTGSEVVRVQRAVKSEWTTSLSPEAEGPP